MKLESKIYSEKIESVPGIYIIYNMKNYKVYIGQAKDLRDRVLDHINLLFLHKENNRFKDNKNLQKEFDCGNNTYMIRNLFKTNDNEKTILNKYESLYYQAAVHKYGREMVYNSIELNKFQFTDQEIKKAEKRIIEILKKELDNKKCYLYTTEVDKKQDWIDMDKSQIISEVKNFNNFNKDTAVIFDEISIKDLINNHKLDYLLVGKMGDYIGKNDSQKFSQILIEKIADISEKGACLWATAGPNVNTFKRFRIEHGFDENNEKKIYALFSLTTSKFNNEIKDLGCYSYTWNGKNLFDTAPNKKRFKALIISKIWSVKEDFILESLFDQYYNFHYGATYHTYYDKFILNTDISNLRNLNMIVSNNEVKNNISLRKDELGMNDELFKEFLERNLLYDKIKYNENEHVTRYFIAEVLDYVWMNNVNY